MSEFNLSSKKENLAIKILLIVLLIPTRQRYAVKQRQWGVRVLVVQQTVQQALIAIHQEASVKLQMKAKTYA